MNMMTEPAGRTLTDESYFVFYGDHDRESPAGFMVRNGLETAERSAQLMSECGYRFTEVRHALSVADFPDT